MRPGVRCCIVATFDEVAESELNVARRLLGSGSIEWILPHITLVPPQKCSVDVAWALAVRVARLATSVAPVDVELAGFGTFANRRVSGHIPVVRGAAELDVWRQELGSCGEDRPYVPHVTLLNHIDLQTAQVLTDQLAAYRLSTTVAEVTLLVANTHSQRRAWRPLLRAVIGYGVRQQRSHYKVVAVLSRTAPVMHRSGSNGVSCWLLRTTGELLGWVEVVPGPSGLWVLGPVVLCDEGDAGFGLEELMVDRLVDYLRPASVVVHQRDHPLERLGARSLSLKEVGLLRLDSFDEQVLGERWRPREGRGSATEDDGAKSQGISWKFLSFSTR